MTNKKKELVKHEKLQAIALPAKIIQELSEKTPKIFIKKRQGKGNLTLSYVSGGYMVKKLNDIFTPIGWNFTIKEKIVEITEVAVLGELTVKFPNGFEVTKSQFGTKERLAKMPLGDALKSAATDSLKKCASLLGIALDVYSSILEDEDGTLTSRKVTVSVKPPKKTEKDITDNIEWIKTVKHTQTLLIAKDRIEKSDEYSNEQKSQMIKTIESRLKQISNE